MNSRAERNALYAARTARLANATPQASGERVRARMVGWAADLLSQLAFFQW